jgi:hypothetical protein
VLDQSQAVADLPETPAEVVTMADIDDEPPTTDPRHLAQNLKPHLSGHVKHEADAKHRIEASVPEGEVLAITLYKGERDRCVDLGAHLGPGHPHHLI